LKIVIDTNVLISALIFPGVSSEIFDSIVQNHEIVLSEWILEEFSRKCREKFKIPADVIAEVLKLLEERITVENPKGEIPEICRDRDDNNILWIADSTKAEIILSGDQDLLVLKEYKEIRILSPRQYKAGYLGP
jgi:putative PIN family toxin of toxin-antitoxin system